MSTLLRYALLPLMLIAFYPVAHASLPVAVLIDYALIPTADRATLPTELIYRGNPGLRDARIDWIVISPVNSVRMGLTGTDARDARPVSVARDFADLDALRAAGAGLADVLPSSEALSMLRGRRRELGLHSARSAADAPPTARDIKLANDARIAGLLPEHFAKERVRAKFVERLVEGGLRLHLGEVARAPAAPSNESPFSATIDFADFEDFNRATGEAITGADFWRPTLSFWRVSGRHRTYVMKTRTEAAVDCAHALGAFTRRPRAWTKE